MMRNEEQLAALMQLFLNCFELSPEIVVIAIVYLDRLVVRCDTADDDFSLTQHNIKLALYGCLVLAAKFYEDRFENHTIFHAIVGISRKHMRAIMKLIL